MTESNYIKCLRKGHECGQEGISYWEMIDYLIPFGVQANNYDFHVYFFKWFFDNFHQQIITDSRIRDLKIVFHPSWLDRSTPISGNPQLNMKAIITFEAEQRYFDYLLLKESDRKADRANALSWWAIRLTILSLISSVVIGIVQICQPPVVNTVILSSRQCRQQEQDTLYKSTSASHDTTTTKNSLNH